MKNVKRLFVLLYVILFSTGFFALASDYNTLYVKKDNLESYLTGKYFCNYKLNVSITGQYQYNQCQYYLAYDPSHETLSFITTKTPWGDATNPGSSVLNIGGNNITVFGGDVSTSQKIKGYTVIQELNLYRNWTGSTPTELYFVDSDGNRNITYNCSNNTKHLEVGGMVNGADCNTLGSVQGLTIPYEACPCNMDKDAPKVTEASHKFTSEKVLSGRYVGEQIMKFLVYDYSGSAGWSYWYSGFSNTDLTKYQGVPSTLFVDNQEGVNSGTIKVKIEYLDPAYGSMSGKSDEFGTGGAGFYSIHEYTGTLKNGNNNKYISEKTWDSNYRGYWIEVKNTTGFLVEKKVKLTIEATDNELDRDGDVVCERKGNNLKSMIWSGYINQPTDPEIEWIYPEDSSSSINPNLTVSMKLSDDWAGIDTGSLVVDVIYPECTGNVEDETFECTTKTKALSSGNFFTGWMFELTGSGQPGLGKTGSYVVTFTLSDLPTETGIILSGYVKDLADNHTGSQITFYTRMPCSTFGCRDSFKVSWLGWDGNIGNIEFPKGTGSVVILVTGSNNISFAGDGNSELMCGPQREQAYLTGNIKMFDSEGNLIIGDYNITDYNNEGVNSTGIYLTGLDVRYDEDSNVLVIDD